MSRRTKKDIYREYGIEFNGSQIKTPFGNWVAPLLAKGNTKIGKGAVTFSIMHGNEIYTRDSFRFDDIKEVFDITGCDAVKGSCPCHCNKCYCDSANYTMYSTAYKSNLFKLILARTFPDFVRRAITAQIIADKIKQCRIHAAGDFFSEVYANVWQDIIQDCPDCIFWTYTKEATAVHAFDTLENVTVVPSITPAGINFGTCAELLEMRKKLLNSGYRVHVCACGTPYEKHCCDCSHGCKAIGTECDYVIFIKHSCTDYKAGKTDPAEYEKIVEIIKSQNN